MMAKRVCRAFTLVELLVVISIIALLLAIMMPSLQKARQIAKRTVCATNLKQIGVAMDMYRSDYRGAHPYRNYHPRIDYKLLGWNPATTWGMTLIHDYCANQSKLFICPSAKLTKPWDGKMGWKDGSLGWAGNYAYNYLEYELQKPDGGRWNQPPASSMLVVDGAEQSAQSNYLYGYGYYGWAYPSTDPKTRLPRMTFGISPYEIPYERHGGSIGVLLADEHIAFIKRADFKFASQIVIGPDGNEQEGWFSTTIK